MSEVPGLQDRFLSLLLKDRVPISIYLVNGIKLQGQLVYFDKFVLRLQSATDQLVYKHAVSTIVPAHSNPSGPKSS